MMDQAMEIYWLVADILRNFSWTIATIFIVLGILRPIKLYAFAEPITIKNEFIYSSFLLRMAWRMTVFIGWEDDNDDDIDKPYGADIRGTCIDVFVTAFGGTILSVMWPVVVLIMIGFFPIEAMHNRHKKKKEFIAKLKGGQLEET